MATPVETVSDYISAVGRSKLLEEGELTTLRSAWEKDSGGSEADVDSFRRFLQRQRKLSEYQAKLIQRGRSEGFIIGDYIVLDRIGSGQTAGVYQARHSSSGQVVALKVLPSSKLKESTALNRFQREGRLLTQLDHPNVVRAFQLSQAGTIHFIVMEHLEGETLDAVLDRRKKLPVAESVRLVHQALQGLQHLHEKRMVHRDLKPSNLMITPPGGPQNDNTLTSTVKILDIGLGREMFDEEMPSTRDMQLTGEGALLGTPDYLAPEQARDARNADIRADIYSLGCVLFHLIAGRPPFVERNVMAQMVKHATETAPLLGDIQPGVPRELTAAVAKMLDKDPNRRPQSPIDAVTSIAPFLQEVGRKAEKNVVLPAYQKFLEESSFEMPVINPPPQEPPKTQPPAKSKSATDYKPVRPVSPPPPPTAPKTDFVDVELVTLPAPVVIPQPLPLPKKRVEDDDDDDDYEEEDRSLLDLNKRDFIMLGAGSLAILVAIGAGWVLSRATRKRDDEDTPPGTTK